ncbi:MAG: hypothetical protein J0I34_07260 [Pseudonocardia sp.]|uniref:hypothetical protein n=1 Tax=Actinomycetes TaxID=1760 RepID=UPI00086CDF6E|nr:MULTISPECIES: hypothetical protein [Actinomycetes]MBN9108565.1 hypothetical protein [Pseudonocardia sp.]ODU27445.1 MAG: hypothetical protein ABS80_03450 [Pseudonocardia sp. SCN 72-51]ODV07793.1 MAG: hypothetical protein ABT15_06870 [Pseudonocardia sp. SCN 73-27]
MSTPVPNRKERRSWNRMVAEARDVEAVVPVSDDPEDVIRVHIPTAEALQSLQELQRKADFAGAMAVLIGKDNFDRLNEAQPDAPFTAYRDLIQDVMTDLNLGGPGASPER